MIEALDYLEGMNEGYKNDRSANRSFFPQHDTCPFCKRKLNEVFSDGIIEYDPEDKDSTKDIHHSVTARSCKCGWWTVHDVQTPDAHNLYASADWVFRWSGILRKFSLADPSIPMDSLRSAIAKHPGQ
ncbi:MAG: hypothetical protein HY706_18940 [Candidatus Hydrogenedentes bacterium]|nr:hypothetical protein [Candidatus Hydrogenedentota bacterium]